MSIQPWHVFDMVAGDQSDALVLSDPTLYSIQSIQLSAEGPAFGWTLFLAPAAGAARRDIVVIDSVDAGGQGITLVDPNANGAVVNVQIDCPEKLVPVVAGVPFTLRVTTSGKVGVGRIRVAWSTFDGVGGLL